MVNFDDFWMIMPSLGTIHRLGAARRPETRAVRVWLQANIMNDSVHEELKLNLGMPPITRTFFKFIRTVLVYSSVMLIRPLEWPHLVLPMVCFL